MSCASFQFKKFTVWQDSCAMKVGTDGVLLGAWADVEGAQQVLDVGTGTGLLALMTAQRSGAEVLGIDIDTAAVQQAESNARRSPWAERLMFQQADALDFMPGRTFDAIVCNPPFFAEKSLHSPDKKRAQARHASSLPLQRLAGKCAEWLRDGGMLSVILPPEAVDTFLFACWEAGLNAYRRCVVHAKPGKPIKRVLLGFKKGRAAYPVETRICLTNEAGERTPDYTNLTKDFYLKP